MWEKIYLKSLTHLCCLLSATEGSSIKDPLADGLSRTRAILIGLILVGSVLVGHVLVCHVLVSPNLVGPILVGHAPVSCNLEGSILVGHFGGSIRR